MWGWDPGLSLLGLWVGACLIWKVVFYYLLIFDLCFSRFGDAFGEVVIRLWLACLVALALRKIFLRMAKLGNCLNSHKLLVSDKFTVPERARRREPLGRGGMPRSGRDLPNETSVSGDASSALAATAASIAPTPPPSANAVLREVTEAREKRARESGGGAGATEPGPSLSGGGHVAMLSDLAPSEESDRCAICGGISVTGNELVHCGFGDGRCIQELGESTAQRACWHVACVPELKAPRPQHVVCARHEADARFRLHVDLTRNQQQEYVVLPLESYKNGEFDSASNGSEVEHVDPHTPQPIT